jgi:predicted MFS family arabinose efflux permease
MKTPRARGQLWSNHDFLWLWAGQTASQAGSQVSELALPLTGILVLHATPGALGVLTAAQFAPSLIVTLLAGVWADRHRRRPTLLAVNLGRAAILAVVPVLAITGNLSMPALYAVALSAGILTAQFDVTYVSYVPSLVARANVMEANAKMQSSQSVAQVAGQGVAGIVAQLLTAPGAVAVDVCSYLMAAFSLVRIRHSEPPPMARSERRGVAREAAAGLRVALGHDLLRPVMLQSAAFNLFNAVVLVVLPLHAVRTLHLSPATLGLVIAFGGLGAVAGALSAQAIGRRLQSGPSMVLGMGFSAAAFVALPLAGGGRELTIAELLAAECALGAGIALFNVHALSLRQRIVSDRLLGRVTASYRLVSWAMIPPGALLGGAAAGGIGTRLTLLCSGLGLSGCTVLFAASRGGLRGASSRPAPSMYQRPASGLDEAMGIDGKVVG